MATLLQLLLLFCLLEHSFYEHNQSDNHSLAAVEVILWIKIEQENVRARQNVTTTKNMGTAIYYDGRV